MFRSLCVLNCWASRLGKITPVSQYHIALRFCRIVLPTSSGPSKLLWSRYGSTWQNKRQCARVELRKQCMKPSYILAQGLAVSTLSWYIVGSALPYWVLNSIPASCLRMIFESVRFLHLFLLLFLSHCKISNTGLSVSYPYPFKEHRLGKISCSDFHGNRNSIAILHPVLPCNSCLCIGGADESYISHSYWGSSVLKG